MTALFLAKEPIPLSYKTRHGHLVKSDAACDFLLNAALNVLHMFLHLISRPSAARGLRRVGVDELDAGCSLSSDACGPSAGWPWSTIRLPPVHTYTKTSGQPAVLTTEKEKGKEAPGQADDRVSENGDPGTNRTCDPLLRRQLLYPLSYGAFARPVDGPSGSSWTSGRT